MRLITSVMVLWTGVLLCIVDPVLIAPRSGGVIGWMTLLGVAVSLIGLAGWGIAYKDDMDKKDKT